jgi:hypothetical protein
LELPKGPYTNWSLEESIDLLNQSSWAKQETFTRVLGGIGSGIQGEKEIYNTFYVRILSAQPVRQAFARTRQIHMGYDELDPDDKRKADFAITEWLNLDVERWIVISVAYRSNIHSQQSVYERHFERQTLETMKTDAYLSTANHNRLELVAYYPPRDASVGAKFVFPKRINQKPVIGSDDESLVFELDIPSSSSDLRVVFSVQDMKVGGELFY